MSTYALIGIKRHDGPFIVKYAHYGSIDDYRSELSNADFDDFFDSVKMGASTQPFEGSFLDYDYCVNELHWPEDIFFDSMEDNCSKVLDTFAQLSKYANDKGVSYIYIKHEDQSLDIYEYNGREYVDMFAWFDEIEPVDLSELKSMSDDELKSYAEETLDLDQYVTSLYADDLLKTVYEERMLDAKANGLDRNGIIEMLKRFNTSIPEIKNALRGGL